MYLAAIMEIQSASSRSKCLRKAENVQFSHNDRVSTKKRDLIMLRVYFFRSNAGPGL